MDAAIIGTASAIKFDIHEEFEWSGHYTLEIESVLYGGVEATTLRLPFHVVEDPNGHSYGNQAPSWRSIVYVRQTADGYDVVKVFSCR